MGTPARHSIDVPGLGHGSIPIPAASRVGNLIATGGVRGVNPATGEMPASVTEQVERMFDNLRAILEAAGGSMDTLLKLTIYIKLADARPAINPAWLKHFPDAARRPARHIIENDRLGGGMLVQCEAWAVAADALSATSSLERPE
jgi:2-iminobutanoate/2-iminopropanoate deaminase